ncbi:MAG TPA: flagellar biosynthesis anti-sigma factor FlgM [Rhodocyclaceae bacterium]|nr:flagellar biosynthesis anti-sigma factor FlgM [Rhodocyclaceae bacterium]
MKIDNSVKSTGLVGGDNKTRATRESSSSPVQTSGGTQVALSGKLDQLVAQTPVVDGAKVDEIKQAISSGRFQVNAEKVADGLIDSVRQMLSAQPRSA